VRAFVNPANLVTSASLGAGFVALTLAADGRLRAAALAVLAAALLDAADGSLARGFSPPGRFGSHLDSLADLVAFGVAPALMLTRAAAEAGAVATAVAAVFLVAGAWRLARFQLAPEARRLEGLPIPLAGLALVALTLAVPGAAALGGAVLLAVLMVSAVPFPTVDALARRAREGASAPDTRETPRRRRTPNRPRARRLARPARWRTRR